MKNLHLKALQGAIGAAVLAVAVPSAHASFVDNALTGNIEYNGWDVLNNSALNSTQLSAGFTANEAGSGDATLTMLSGAHFPAGSSIYSFGGDSMFSVADATAISGIETVVFSILTWPNPSFGDGSTAAGAVSVAPVLSYNGGTQALAADYIGANDEGPFSGGGFDVDTFSYTYQWDLSLLAGITDYDIEWGQINHTGLLALQLEQSDSFTMSAAVVPVPAAVWLFGSGLLGLVGIARRRRV